MSAVRISVTQEDIDAANASGIQGARCNGEDCPINRAAQIAFGVPCRTQRPLIWVGDDTKVAWLPQVARDFIWHYDMRHDELCVPFSFQVEDPRK